MARARVDLSELQRILRGKGLRATSSRIGVLALLRAAPGPRSHGEFAEQLAGEPWDKATIYRVLVDLTEAGLARRTDLGDHIWRFESVDGAHTQLEHPHFVCTGCNEVTCLPGVELGLPRRSKARPPRAVRDRRVAVRLHGLCDACS